MSGVDFLESGVSEFYIRHVRLILQTVNMKSADSEIVSRLA